MTRGTHFRPARVGVTVFGGGVALTVALFAGLYLQSARQSWQDRERVSQLQKLAQSDAASAVQLNTEQKRQTDRQQQLRRHYERLSLALLAATIGLVICAKSDAPRRAALAPPRARLVQLRVPRIPAAGLHAPSAAARPAPTPAEASALLARLGGGTEQAIEILQGLQARFGYLPTELLRQVCQSSAITPAQIAGVATFYKRFRHKPVGRRVVQVCHGTACHVAGAGPISDEIRRRFAIPPGDDTDPRREITLDSVACLGCCSLAPVLTIDDRPAARMTPNEACALLGSKGVEPPS